MCINYIYVTNTKVKINVLHVPRAGPTLYSSLKQSAMTHSDEYVLEEVEEVDVVTQTRTLATQMQENAQKIKL